MRRIGTRAEEWRSVRDGRDDVHADDADHDARANASRSAGSGAVFAGGVRGGVKLCIRFRANRQVVLRVGLQTGEYKPRRIVDARLRLCGGDVYGDCAADADIRVGISRLSGCRGRNRRLFGTRNCADVDRARRNVTALDGGVVRVLDHRDRDADAYASGLAGRGGGIRPDGEVRRNRNLRRSNGYGKAVRAVRLFCGVAGHAARALLDHDGNGARGGAIARSGCCGKCQHIADIRFRIGSGHRAAVGSVDGYAERLCGEPYGEFVSLRGSADERFGSSSGRYGKFVRAVRVLRRGCGEFRGVFAHRVEELDGQASDLVALCGTRCGDGDGDGVAQIRFRVGQRNKRSCRRAVLGGYAVARDGRGVNRHVERLGDERHMDAQLRSALGVGHCEVILAVFQFDGRGVVCHRCSGKIRIREEHGADLVASLRSGGELDGIPCFGRVNRGRRCIGRFCRAGGVGRGGVFLRDRNRAVGCFRNHDLARVLNKRRGDDHAGARLDARQIAELEEVVAFSVCGEVHRDGGIRGSGNSLRIGIGDGEFRRGRCRAGCVRGRAVKLIARFRCDFERVGLRRLRRLAADEVDRAVGRAADHHGVFRAGHIGTVDVRRSSRCRARGEHKLRAEQKLGALLIAAFQRGKVQIDVTRGECERRGSRRAVFLCIGHRDPGDTGGILCQFVAARRRYLKRVLRVYAGRVFRALVLRRGGEIDRTVDGGVDMNQTIFARNPLRARRRDGSGFRGARYCRVFFRFLQPVRCVGGRGRCRRAVRIDVEFDRVHIARGIDQGVIRIDDHRDAERAGELNGRVGCLCSGVCRCFARGHRFPFSGEGDRLRAVHIGRHREDKLAVFIRAYHNDRFACRSGCCARVLLYICNFERAFF